MEQQQPNAQQLKEIMKNIKPTPDQMEKAIYSLQTQLSDYIGKVTDKDVQLMTLQQEKLELEKELEKYREKEIETMDAE